MDVNLIFSLMKEAGITVPEIMIIVLLWQNLKQLKRAVTALQNNLIALDRRVVRLEVEQHAA